MSDRIIISIAVFSHGMEDLLHPFDETSEVGKFYKENVRVYSQSCVPDVPSITASHTHGITAKTLVDLFQTDEEKHTSTSSIMKPVMERTKKEYTKKLRSPKTKTLHPTFDKWLFEDEYIEKSCGIMSYLANKEFFFSKESDPKWSLEGMVVLDVRVKRTSSDGTESYERIMNIKNHIDITTYDGLMFLLKDVLLKKKPEATKIIDEIANEILHIPKLKSGKTNFKSGSKITEINLVQLHKILKKLNVDYVNIVDYSCRICDTRLTKKQIDTIYKKEQEHALLAKHFGGRTIRNRKKHRKTRKRLYR